MHEKLSDLPDTTAGEKNSEPGEYYAHIGDEDMYEALAIIDTRERNDVNILRVEPSGSPDPEMEDGMYIAWVYTDE